MPASHKTLDLNEARRKVILACLVPESPPLVGVELEWLTVMATDNGRVNPDPLRRRLGPVLPCGSRLTFEPGGQLEVSSPPSATIDGACRTAGADVEVATRVAAALGVSLQGTGNDPIRYPRRVVDSARYAAMEAYFDAQGTAGRTMMCNTAAVQVNVGVCAGTAGERQWELAHLLGPTLAAAFANSPLAAGSLTGSASTRLAVWSQIDRSRTAPVYSGPPAESWARYVLDAHVMLIRPPRGAPFQPVLTPLTFRQWVEDGHPLGYPTADDLEYHISTLFPPVRPRGWLEIRMVDALPEPWWRVAVAVIGALLLDSEAGDEAARAAAGTGNSWAEAYRFGLGDPALAISAQGVFAAAAAGLARLGVSHHLRSLVARYCERYVACGRSPANDRVDGWVAANGAVPPVALEAPALRAAAQ